MELNLSGKVAVITGGSTGIGKALALEFAREGVQVAVFARGADRLEAVAREFESMGFSLFYGQADVCDIESVERFAKSVADRFGRIDIWVNNAGISVNKFCMDFTPGDWDKIVNTNLRSVFFGMRIAASYMMKQKGGVILNASSFASKIPHAGGSIYAATKAAVSNLTRSFAAELAPFNIRVVSFIPGMIETEMSRDFIAEHRAKLTKDIAMQRIGRPEDLAKPLVFLASDAAGYITGVDVEISGGKYAVQNNDYSWLLHGIKPGQ